ncbi:VWA domain-containing protein [Actinoplanes bogorensis]|uniref:VWA domain-containing protein n=1 Tax=Paractinoplanes bogorensis TaxID=1610840 RepID=A0ABS5YPZ3_9ACTN|nr:VWA domain-containing protein [Actinoplanes bogorensis]MBU2664788.1 VWA domain-containing protein [Actinoplanes bogorensis]
MWSEALAALLLAVAVPLPVEAVLADGDQTSVVVDLSAAGGPAPGSAAVTIDGERRTVPVVPLMSAGLAVTIVVDTSATDVRAVPAWLSAGARFILEAPTGTRATVIGDSAPATVIAPPQQDPTGIVAALDAVEPKGPRDTAQALSLAAAQFPDVPAGRKIAVVYTGAADAGGLSAGDLAEKFKAAGVILVVATTADASPYWTAAAEATGGFFAPAGNPAVVPALDQVETTLSSRYLVTFPTPLDLPTTVPVQVTTPDLTLTADVTLAAPAAAPPADGPDRLLIALAAATAGVVAAGLLVTWLLLRRSRRRRRPPPIVIAHGRATVPGPPSGEA